MGGPDIRPELFTDWYWEQDAELRFTRFEGHAANISGQRPQEAIGATRWELPGIAPVCGSWEEHRRTLDQRLPFRDFEYYRVQADGSRRYVSVSGEPVFGPQGEFLGYRGISTDVTHRKRAEEALRIAELNYRLIFDNAVEGMYRVESDGRVSMANLALARMLGYGSPEEMLTGVQEVAKEIYVDPSERGRYRKLLAQNGVLSGFETQWRRRDGSVIWVSLSGRLVNDPSGASFHLGAAADITERKRAEQLLALEHSVARMFADGRSPEGVLQDVLGEVCRSQGWECARYFALDEAAGLMRLTHTWHDGTAAMREFTEGSRNVAFRRGEGLVGHVWASGESLWVPDVGRDPRVAMRALAARAGVHGALVIPVMFERRMIGTLSISSPQIREPDDRLRVALEMICRQLGQFLQRKQVEEEQRSSRQLLTNIIENIPTAVQLKSVRQDYRIVLWNKAAEAMYGVPRGDAIGRTVHDLWPEEAAERMRAADEDLVRSGGMHEFPDRIAQTRHRGEIHVHMRKVALLDPGGAVSHLLVIADDISARRDAEARQAANLRYQECLARFGQAAVARRDAAGLLDDALGTLREALACDDARFLDRCDPDALGALGWPGRYPSVLVQMVAGEGAAERGALCVLAAQPGTFGDEEGRFLAAMASVLSSGLQRIESEARLAFLAQFDPLTGLPNRALLADRFEQMIVQARRHERPLGVLFIDLDHFKHVNDTLGHAGGDALLREVARRLQDCVRPGDTVARISGDEFAVLLGDLARAEDAALVAQKILDRLAAPINIAGKETFVSASVGIATYPPDGAGAEELLRAADAAMYRAKQAGRNAFQFFTPEIDQRTRARAQLGSDLRRALERGEFELAYQPKIDLRTGAASGAEALLRWRRPGEGVVPPAEFIPVLEETGLIVAVGEWVVRQACEDLKAWQAEGIAPVPVAVNLSARQFRQQDLGARIRGIVAGAGVNPALIELEITESQLMQDPEQAVRTLQDLHDAGMRIAIDDFGTGYSSLSYLTRFPLTSLKIDRSFVADALEDTADATIVRTIVDMAHTLKLIVVAEGVETEAQAAFLRGLGCEQAQGYLFARPMPAAAFKALISSGSARPSARPSGKARRASRYQ